MRKLNPYYVSGLVDGEGSFYVGILPRNLKEVKYEVRPSFSLSQNRRNRGIVFQLKEFFGCGNIRPSKRDKTVKYEVRSIDDLFGKIIPHFEKYPLRGKKSDDFRIFKKILRMVKEGRHLKKDGLREVVSLALEMNVSPKREKLLGKIITLLKE